ncbi:MAG: TlpA disulfide reductase family protein [Halofilum sp. (in: g-proteobacteria)]
MIRSALVLASPQAALAHAAWAVFAAPGHGGSAPESLAVHDNPRDLPLVEFDGEDGEPLALDSFAGKIVVLKVWATWCPPCREEMPTLDALQDQLGGNEFEVVALSVDQAGPEAVRAFFLEIDTEHLALYIDESMRTMAELRIRGVPTTLILDRRGREVARLTGEADWAAPPMVAYLRALISGDQVEAQ